MKKVYIVHGYTGYPDKNWFPWLKTELEKLGVAVEVPAMPHSENPVLSEWLPYLQDLINDPDQDTYLIGHSLGCVATMRYLESLPEGRKVGGVIWVAGFASPIHLTQLNNFFETPLNPEKIKVSADKIVAINSDNDPHVPYEQAEEIQSLFGAELFKINKGGHLNEKSGYKEFPFLLEKIKEIVCL